MRRLLVLVGLLLVMVGHRSEAGPGGCMGDTIPSFTAFAFEQITVSTSAIGFTSATYAPTGAVPANLAIVNVESQAIRYRDDGVNPTSTVGQPAAADTVLTACGTQAIRLARFIRSGGSDATLSVTYYKASQ